MSSSMVAAAEISIAGRLKSAVALEPSASTTAVPGAALRSGGNVHADVVQERHDVRRPAHRHRRGAERVLEDQVPADDPRDQLAERRVAVGVGGAGDRHRRGELRIADRREARWRCRRRSSTGRRPGPACAAAAWPVSTKMPVPMMAPMPSRVRSIGPSTRFSGWCGIDRLQWAWWQRVTWAYNGRERRWMSSR